MNRRPLIDWLMDNGGPAVRNHAVANYKLYEARDTPYLMRFKVSRCTEDTSDSVGSLLLKRRQETGLSQIEPDDGDTVGPLRGDADRKLPSGQ